MTQALAGRLGREQWHAAGRTLSLAGSASHSRVRCNQVGGRRAELDDGLAKLGLCLLFVLGRRHPRRQEDRLRLTHRVRSGAANKRKRQKKPPLLSAFAGFCPSFFTEVGGLIMSCCVWGKLRACVFCV